MDNMPIRWYRLVRGSLYALALAATLIGHYELDHHGEPHVHAEPIHNHQELIYMVNDPHGKDTTKMYVVTPQELRIIDSVENLLERKNAK